VADFCKAALPWVAGGIAVAVILTFGNSKRKIQNNKKK